MSRARQRRPLAAERDRGRRDRRGRLARVDPGRARGRATRGPPVSIAGGRHAMGGQQFCSGGVLLDTRPLSPRALARPRARPRRGRGGHPVARARSTRSPRHALGDPPEADRCRRPLRRRRGLGERPRARADVRRRSSPTSSSSSSSARRRASSRCSRDENADLFRLVCGGYGLFGVVCSATLRLDRRSESSSASCGSRDAEELEGSSRSASRRLPLRRLPVRDRPGLARFLRHGVFSCYRPVPDDDAAPARTRS